MVNEWLEHTSQRIHQSKKQRRHIGPPDHGGFQRLIQTGSITSSFSNQSSSNAKSVDVIVATYWMYPSKVRVITQIEKECIEEYRNLSKHGKS